MPTAEVKMTVLWCGVAKSTPGRRRRQEGDFPGKQKILAQLRHQHEFLHLLQLHRNRHSAETTAGHPYGDREKGRALAPYGSDVARPPEERRGAGEEEEERMMKNLQVELELAADRAGIPEEFRLRKRRVGFVTADATMTPAKRMSGRMASVVAQEMRKDEGRRQRRTGRRRRPTQRSVDSLPGIEDERRDRRKALLSLLSSP